MGRGDLSDMYTQAQGRAAPKGKCGHIRQMTQLHMLHIYVILHHGNITTLWQQYCLDKPTMHHHYHPLQFINLT